MLRFLAFRLRRVLRPTRCRSSLASRPSVDALESRDLQVGISGFGSAHAGMLLPCLKPAGQIRAVVQTDHAGMLLPALRPVGISSVEVRPVGVLSSSVVGPASRLGPIR